MCPTHRAMQKMKQVRRLKLEEVKVLAEEGIELNAAEYQRQVEEREAQRRQEREERLAREAMMTLEAMEREEQEAAEAAAKAAETPAVEGEDDMRSKRLQSVFYVCKHTNRKAPEHGTRLMWATNTVALF